jgi:hypothetical protein
MVDTDWEVSEPVPCSVRMDVCLVCLQKLADRLELDWKGCEYNNRALDGILGFHSDLSGYQMLASTIIPAIQGMSRRGEGMAHG